MNSQTQSRELLQSVLETLRQGERLLAGIGDDDFIRKTPAAFNASIGGHFRHVLDHFRLLLNATPSGDVNYDHRERGTLIEHDRFAALNATRELIAGWENVNLFHLARPLTATCQTSYTASGTQSAPSTVAREVMYAVAHAVHHYALISVMVRIMEIRLPENFGIAPSTLKHQQAGVKTA